MHSSKVNLTVLASCVESGGAETALFQMLMGLSREQFQPRLVCLRREPGFIAKELQAKGIPLVFGLSRGKFDPFVGRRLVQVLGKQLEILYCLHHHNVLFWVPYLLRRISVKSTILICHTTINPDGGPYFWTTDRSSLQYVQRIIAVAFGQKSYLVDAVGVPAEQIEVIHNGIFPEYFADPSSQPADRAQVRQEWGLTEEHRVAMIIALLRPEKNHARFLRVARAVAERMPEARFIVVGDGPERRKLESYAEALGIANLVRFVGIRRDVPRVLAAADVVTLTSNAETFPLALLEGMAAGRPVVATRVGSIEEMLIEGKTGHLIPVDNETAFADALHRLLSDRMKAEAMGKAGRRFVLQHFTVERMVRAHEELFQQLLTATSMQAESVWHTPDLGVR